MSLLAIWSLTRPTRVAYRTRCATRALAKPTTRMAVAVTVTKSMVHGWSPSRTRSKCPERIVSIQVKMHTAASDKAPCTQNTTFCGRLGDA